MLTVHRSERGDILVDALAEVLATPPADPFAAEVIAVPARGVERWISQRIASRLGIAANIEFPTPASIVADAIAAASEIDRDDDPWRGEGFVWLVLAAIDQLAFDPAGAALGRHLGVVNPGGWEDQPGHRPKRRYATAELLAGLLRSYGSNRPDMLADWAAGADTDGRGGPLPADLTWQAELFRRVRELAGTPSPAERLPAACARLRNEPGLVDLPDVFSVYGLTRLPTDHAAVLEALAVTRDVHLWLPHPSPVAWIGEVDATSQNPLLTSLGRESRELQTRVRQLAHEDRYHPAPPRPATLLGRLQESIAQNREPTAGAAAGSAGPDGTLEFHACHGPSRLIEVLRERLVRLFEDDPTLQPRDVLVACPDVETYAPLIRSAFGPAAVARGPGPGRGEAHPAQSLRVRMADRSLRFTNPLLDAVASVLELSEGRATIAQVLDLAATEPVRRRFRFTDSNIERLRQWAGPSGARWGLDGSTRERFGLGGFPQNTLRTALDRIVLGVVAEETHDEWLGLGLPLDDVDSTDIDLVGRFADYLDVLTAAAATTRGRHSARTWADLLIRLAGDVADVPPADAGQVAQAGRELAGALRSGDSGELTLTEVRGLLASRLAAKPTRANFRTGDLTVCTLVPMRSVPHRVVVLLGLDDEVFPRSTRLSGDDVLGRSPCPGERDPRAEDRQLFLDAVTSATDRVLVLYTGADPVKGTARPPAVPVAELRDAARALLPDPTASGLEFTHTLQPFHPANFDPTHFGVGAAFSYDPAAYAGAVAATGEPSPPPPFLAAPLAARAVDDVELDDLIRFIEHPVKGFLRQRLGLTVRDVDDDIDVDLAIAPDGLRKWHIGDRILRSTLDGAAADRIAAAELRRGDLPPFALGTTVLAEITHNVDALSRAAAPLRTGAADTVDVTVDLGDGRRLVGSVPAVRNGTLVRASYSTLAPKHRLTAWVSLVALASVGKGQSAYAVGRDRYRGTRISRLTAPADPVAVLRELIDLRDRGLTEALPVFTQCSATYAELRRANMPPHSATESARESFTGDYGETHDLAIAYALGATAFDDAQTPPHADEAGWSAEPTRFGAYAARLWAPLLRNEESI